MNTNGIELKIEKAHYAVTERDVELLALSRVTHDDAVKRTDGAYLRILIAAMQADLGNSARKLTQKDIDAHRAKLSDLHTKFYQAVLRGVTTPELADEDGLAPEERQARARLRNARGAFARSAASTLQGYIKLGGDVRRLDVATVKKMDLQRFIQDKRILEEPEERFVGVANRLAAQAKALMAENPDSARPQIEEAIRVLQALLDEDIERPAQRGRDSTPQVEVLGHTQTSVRRRQTAKAA